MTTKNPHAQALGKLGGEARARNLTPEEMSEGGRQAVNVRWAKHRAAKKKAAAKKKPSTR
jgi:hypothetical protein